MERKKIKIHFYGGAESVTGSNFLFDSDAKKGERVLIDCGMFQGGQFCDERNFDKFPFDPASIQVLFVTHAHIDHIGRIPKLVKDGFRGAIYSTPPTREIAQLSLEDSLNLLEKESRYNKTPALFDQADVDKTFHLWKTVDYHQPVQVGDFTVVLRDAGHVLGSAMVEFMYEPNRRKIVFTGDLGNSPAPLLRDTEKLTDVDYLVMESVYGDRVHEDRTVRKEKLEDIIEATMLRGGTLMIPAFSLERTQELLFEIENMMENSRIPLVPVFLDSPLAIKITEIYRTYKEYFNHDVANMIESGDGIFRFPQFHQTMTTEESKRIEAANPKKIIMAGSGMSTGGRILHHEKKYLSDPRSTLLLVGYQEVGSLGRQLQDGAKHVKIMGEQITVKAQIESISGYSAHKDMNGLIEFVQFDENRLKKVWLAMGEPKASLFLAQRIRDYLGLYAAVPKAGEIVEIEL